MIDPTRSLNPFDSLPIDEVVAMKFRVTVLGGQHVATYGGAVAEMQLVGLPHDTSHIFRTKPSKAKLDPIWTQHNVLEMPQVILPDVALLRVSLTDSKGSMGWAVLPLNSIRPGFRVVPLEFARTRLAHLVLKFELRISTGRFSDFAEKLFNPIVFASESAQNFAAMDDLIGLGDQEINPGGALMAPINKESDPLEIEDVTVLHGIAGPQRKSVDSFRDCDLPTVPSPLTGVLESPTSTLTPRGKFHRASRRVSNALEAVLNAGLIVDSSPRRSATGSDEQARTDTYFRVINEELGIGSDQVSVRALSPSAGGGASAVKPSCPAPAPDAQLRDGAAGA